MVKIFERLDCILAYHLSDIKYKIYIHWLCQGQRGEITVGEGLTVSDWKCKVVLEEENTFLSSYLAQ